MDNVFSKTIHISNSQYIGLRLDSVIATELSGLLSRTEVQKAIANKQVSINGIPIVKSSHIIEHFLDININIYKVPSVFKIVPSQIKVPILYEDDNIAVVHKPYQMTVHPGSGTHNDTLVHSLVAQLDNLSESENNERPGIVHRLDRDTEGILVVAKNNTAHRLLSTQFMERTIYKEYHAWLDGIPNQDSGTIIGQISRHKTDRKLMEFTFEGALNINAKYAEMSYEVIKRVASFCLVRIVLKTGRTHQIRASFRGIKLSVINDDLYAFRKQRKLPNKVKDLGLLLIANKIAFTHPMTCEKMQFSIPFPERFMQIEELII